MFWLEYVLRGNISQCKYISITLFSGSKDKYITSSCIYSMKNVFILENKNSWAIENILALIKKVFIFSNFTRLSNYSLASLCGYLFDSQTKTK